MATQIGAQMYTLRDHCKTPSDIARTCERLNKIGFGAVQASALGPIEPTELKKILDDNGLVCAATHHGMDQMKDAQACIDYHQTLGCELTAIGGFGFKGGGEQQWREFVQQYNQIAKGFKGAPLRIGYHNHSHELSPFGLAEHPDRIDPKNTALQLLVDELDDSVWFEIDTYWIAHGGGDPAQWIRKVAESGSDRIPAVHVKDMTVTPDRQQKMCEIGAGNLNWPAILDACKQANVRWYLIERDDGDLDPFESLRISLENLRAMGLQ